PVPPRPVRSCRRGGGGGAFFTLLVVVAVVLGFRSFLHNKHVREQRRVEQTQARGETKKVKSNRSKPAKNPPAHVDDADQRPAIVMADATEEIIKGPELPEDQQKSGWILGFGSTREDATQTAYEKAYEKALAYLHENMPGVEWTPTRAYVR